MKKIQPSVFSILLQEMNTRDLVMSMVYLKEGVSPLFHEAAFYHGFQKLSYEHQEFASLFMVEFNGDIKPPSSELEDTLYWLRDDIPLFLSDQHRKLSAHGKEIVETDFKEKYGEHFLEEVEPLAELVWAEAKKYRCQHNRLEFYKSAVQQPKKKEKMHFNI